MATQADAAFRRHDEPARREAAPLADRADVGVLCVHGIGVQDEGATLLAIAKPLLDALTPDGGRVLYADACLKPQRQLVPGPAYLHATVEGPWPEPELFPPTEPDPAFVAAPSESTRVLLAESWWAQVFDAPSYGQLLGWLLSYGTWIAIRHTVFRLATPLRWLERQYERRGKPVPDWLGLTGVMYAIPGSLLAVVFVAIPMQLALLAIGLLAVVPLKSTQALARRAALGASAVLGDASVYTANDAIRATILARVRSDLDWIAARSKRVVVLAHSQGAAVAFDLLRSIDRLGEIHLVTYGAGIRKLSELEEDARSKPFIVRLCALLWLAGIVGASMAWFAGLYLVEAVTAASAGASAVSAAAGAIGDRVGSLLLFYLSIGMLVLALVFNAARSREPEIDRRLLADMKGLLRKRLRWADLYASSDPVPGGPLLGANELKGSDDGWQAGTGALRGFRSRRVVNRMSTFSDHISYWQGPNDFLPALAGQLRSWLGLPASEAPMNLQRVWRVRCRKVAGLLLGAVAIAAFFRAGDPLRDVVFVPLWDLLPIKPDSMSARLIEHYGLRRLAIGAAGLATNLGLVLLYGRFVLDPSWDALERSVQRYRAHAHAGADHPFAVLAQLVHRVGPFMRAALCTGLFAAPMGLLFAIVMRGRFDPALSSLLLLGEFGRDAWSWALLVAMAFACIAALVFAWQRWRGDDTSA